MVSARGWTKRNADLMSAQGATQTIRSLIPGEEGYGLVVEKKPAYAK